MATVGGAFGRRSPRRQRTWAPRELFRRGAVGAQPAAQPAKTALFAGVKEPGLRANFFALIN